MRSWGKLKSVFFFVFTAAIVGGLFIYSIWGDNIPLERVRNLVHSPSAPFIFVLIYAGLSFIMPTTPLMAIAGVLFGFVWGVIYSLVGGVLGCIAIFFLSRRLGSNLVGALLEKDSLETFHNYYDKFSRHGLVAVIILRMLPVMPTNVLSLIMGVTRITFGNYLFGTVIGLIPSHVITVYFGTLVLTETFRDISFYLSIMILVGIALWAFWKPRTRAF